jgi:hypothetical protein
MLDASRGERMSPELWESAIQIKISESTDVSSEMAPVASSSKKFTQYIILHTVLDLSPPLCTHILKDSFWSEGDSRLKVISARKWGGAKSMMRGLDR